MSATCINCPFFQSFGEDSRGWCATFDRMARSHHIQTGDCENQIAVEEEIAIASNDAAQPKAIVEEKIAVTPVLVAQVLNRLSPGDDRVFPADIADVNVRSEVVLVQAGNRLVPIARNEWDEAIAQISNMGAHAIACPSCAGDDCAECGGDRALPVEIDAEAEGKTYCAWAGYRLLGTFFQVPAGWWMISPTSKNDRAFRYYYSSREAVEAIALCWEEAQQRQRYQRHLTLLK